MENEMNNFFWKNSANILKLLNKITLAGGVKLWYTKIVVYRYGYYCSLLRERIF